MQGFEARSRDFSLVRFSDRFVGVYAQAESRKSRARADCFPVITIPDVTTEETMSDAELFEEAVRMIQAKYDELDYDRGWRFLYSPKETFKANCDLMLVGLNPADRPGFSPEPILSCEIGNAFRIRFEPDLVAESGIASAQYAKRVCDKFKLLADLLAEPQLDLMDRTLSSNFCPFRASGGLPKMHTTAARAFSRELWIKLCKHLEPKVIMCLGDEAAREFSAIRAKLSPKSEIIKLPHPSSRISNNERSTLTRDAVNEIATLLRKTHSRPAH